jgi:hypothetical protein
VPTLTIDARSAGCSCGGGRDKEPEEVHRAWARAVDRAFDLKDWASGADVAQRPQQPQPCHLVGVGYRDQLGERFIARSSDERAQQCILLGSGQVSTF